MLDASHNDNVYWVFWMISSGAIFSFIGLIFFCICSCRRNNNKSEFLGLAGLVKITHTDHETFNKLSSTEALQDFSHDTVDASERRTTTAKRSLPDIPKDKNGEPEVDTELRDVIYEATENISELYATVTDKSKELEKNGKQVISQQSSQDENSSLYARLKTPQTSTEEHPYAQVQNLTSPESLRNSSCIAIEPSKASPSGINNSSVVIPIAPPRSRRSSSHNSLLEQSHQDIPAASAISGSIHANQDLPYMTPPIMMPLPQPPELNNSQQNFSGDSQDLKGYTSISVREPLANIIAQTQAVQRQNPRSLGDPHYATVSDDSDEMYAAIDEQDKVYTSGSETYAQIQPLPPNPIRDDRLEGNRLASNEHLGPNVDDGYAVAPQPPSVNSLRHAAHAHSRQASSSSATSSGMNPGSPKPEKRQANSPLPPPPENPMDLYAVVDKRNKTDDRHLKTGLTSGKSLEDMYAKVMKKKRGNEDPNRSLDSVNPLSIFAVEQITSISQVIHQNSEPIRTSKTSHESSEIHKREIVQNGEAFEINFLITPNNEPGRRSSVPIEANYETLRPLQTKAFRNSHGSALPIYAKHTAHAQHRQLSDASSEDPGYERVRLRRRVAIDLDTDTEPNYESMPHEIQEPNYASVGGRSADSDLDPNYESVNNGDPNYESVKYMSLPGSEEPPYEQVSNLKRGNYTKSKSNSDYEKIETLTDMHNGSITDEQLK